MTKKKTDNFTKTENQMLKNYDDDEKIIVVGSLREARKKALSKSKSKSILQARPTTLPRWATVPYADPIVGGSNVVEPPEQQKDVGWLRKQKPPANYQNWLHNLTYQWLEYLDKGTINYGITTGTEPDYLLTIPGITEYFDGLTLQVNIHSTNTTAIATLDLNGLGNKSIKRSDGLAIDSGDLRTANIYWMTYDGTEFRITAIQRATQLSRGIIRLSTAAETKAATDDTVCISPKNAIHHSGVAKAWVKFNGTDGAIYDSYNVASVTRNGLGDYTVNLGITMANNNYVVTCSTVQAGSAPHGIKPTTYILSQTTTSFILETLGFNITFDAVSNTDADPIFIAVHGVLIN